MIGSLVDMVRVMALHVIFQQELAAGFGDNQLATTIYNKLTNLLVPMSSTNLKGWQPSEKLP